MAFEEYVSETEVIDKYNSKVVKTVIKETVKSDREFERLIVVFTDGTTLTIESWDYECYVSGLRVE